MSASPPQDRRWELLDDGPSNFDHQVPDGLEDQLKSGEFYCDYPAWDFHANVWYENGQFHAYCRRYHRHVGTYSADTIRELMKICSDSHGYD
jgi:hypothetical protein